MSYHIRMLSGPIKYKGRKRNKRKTQQRSSSRGFCLGAQKREEQKYNPPGVYAHEKRARERYRFPSMMRYNEYFLLTRQTLAECPHRRCRDVQTRSLLILASSSRSHVRFLSLSLCLYRRPPPLLQQQQHSVIFFFLKHTNWRNFLRSDNVLGKRFAAELYTECRVCG